MVKLACLAFQIIINLAFFCMAANQHWCQHLHLSKNRRRGAPIQDIFADTAIFCFEADSIFGDFVSIKYPFFAEAVRFSASKLKAVRLTRVIRLICYSPFLACQISGHNTCLSQHRGAICANAIRVCVLIFEVRS